MKTKKLYINRWQLYWSGACKYHRRKFKKLFGWKAELNEENMRIAVKGGLDVGWFIHGCAKPALRAKLIDLFTKQTGRHPYGW